MKNWDEYENMPFETNSCKIYSLSSKDGKSYVKQTSIILNRSESHEKAHHYHIHVVQSNKSPQNYGKPYKLKLPVNAILA